MRVLLSILALTACTGTPGNEPEPPRYDFSIDPGFSDLGDAVLACGRNACRTAVDSETARACLESSCPEDPAVWRVEPSTIRYEDGTVFVAATVAHTPRTVAGEALPRTEPVFVGVTVIRDDGEEIDLAVSTLFPDGLDAPIMISADVGERVQDVVIGAWSTKIQPCNVDRSGCRDFGFVLDDSLATWPPHFYRDWLKQRIPTEPLTLAVIGDGAVAESAESAMFDYLSIFSMGPERISAVPAASAKPVVRHRHPSDALLARAVAERLGGSIEVTAGATVADIEVVLPTK